MAFALQFVVIAFCAVLLLLVLHLVAQEKLLLKYSLLWLFLVAVTMLCAIFPKGVYAVAAFFGFTMPSNFIFFAGLFCLLAISLSLSVIVSKQALRIRNLTQRLALLENEIHRARNNGHTMDE